jgi:dihydrolipoamide dehydrogenase
MFGANGKALAMGEPEGFVKVISSGKENKIIGVHIMGPHASDLIHEGALAIAHDMNAEDISDTIHAHPTLGEAFSEAVSGLMNEAIHMLPAKKI